MSSRALMISDGKHYLHQDPYKCTDVCRYGSGFFLPFGVMQLAWGTAYFNWKIKTTYLTSITIFEIGSLICALAPNSSNPKKRSRTVRS